jgi:hypothetical protein
VGAGVSACERKRESGDWAEGRARSNASSVVGANQAAYVVHVLGAFCAHETRTGMRSDTKRSWGHVDLEPRARGRSLPSRVTAADARASRYGRWRLLVRHTFTRICTAAAAPGGESAVTQRASEQQGASGAHIDASGRAGSRARARAGKMKDCRVAE